VFDNDRAGVKVTRKFENSLITDTVYLYDNEKYVGFENDIDWNTEHILLKREFPIDVVTDKATCEIQFGNAERPTHANTTWDAAKFEVCAHKYVDLSETDFGVAVVNESKYGYSLNNNDIGLSLLKGATYPDPDADKGKHKIAYALYTHEGSANASTVANFAYKYNNPAIAVEVQGGGNLPSEYSLVSCDSDNVFVETCKIAEDGNDVIVRMFEAKRVRKTVTVNFGFDVKEVYIANMLEKELEKIEVKNNAVTLNVKPFEIITLKVKR
jgi:alpha-mannosidase